MDKVLNYIHTYWKQLTAWRKDGRYDIDNTLAERYIRPLSGERKNSLFYGSQKMSVVLATFDTRTATWHAKATLILKFLKASAKSWTNAVRTIIIHGVFLIS